MKKPAPTIVALAAVLVLAFVGAACSEATSETSTASVGFAFADVNAAFEQLSDASTGAQIVDVREPEEWVDTGVAIGAVLISLGDLEALAPSELAKDKPVYVICASGNRSQTGAQTLVDLGYAEVYSVEGGMTAWVAAGLPVESYRP